MEYIECNDPYLLEMKREEIARQLIRYRLRPPQTTILTRMHRKKVRAIWKQVHQSSPPKGLQPSSCSSLLKKRDMKDVSVFIAIYKSIIPESPLNPERIIRRTGVLNLLDAYRIYCNMFSSKSIVLDFQTVYYLIHDIKYGIATLGTCESCEREYLETVNDKAFWGCPFCNK